jgi:dihydrofolate synthase/folylpolyglutamate synthase
LNKTGLFVIIINRIIDFGWSAMEYKEAIKYLYDLKIYGMSLGLARIERLLHYLGSPDKDLKAVHVAGTNGKGSVCAMISSVLMDAGYKVGLFTSPHLLVFEERIQVNGNLISREELCALVDRIKPIAERMVKEEGFEHPTFFEIACAMAMRHFADQNVDFAVLEVGLGGRLDATNVIMPLVSVITSISLDHTHVLGTTLEEVAKEKAGIIKEGVPVVIGVEQKELIEMIKSISQTKGCTAFTTSENGNYSINQVDPHGQKFDVQVFERGYSDLKIHLIGEHQVKNALIAIMTLELLKEQNVNIIEVNLRDGLANTKWPGRFEKISDNPIIIFDCAHNPAGMRSLGLTMNRVYKDLKKTLVLGIMRDKDIQGIVREACEFADKVIVTKPGFERASEPEIIEIEVREYCPDVRIIKDVAEAVKYAVDNALDNELICIAGSIFNVGEAMEILQKNG